jgi:hypothetical protein
VFFPVECEHLGLALDGGFQVDRARPDLVQISDRVFGVIDAEIDPFVAVFEQQFAAILEIGIAYVNERLSEIGEAGQQLLFDALPISIGDLVNTSFGIELIDEESVLVTEFLGEERIDKGDVVVDPPGFENLLAAESDFLIRLVTKSSQSSYSLPNFPLFQRSSMSFQSSKPSL